MAKGANAMHMQLRYALENYIKSQYFGKSPILLSALYGKLDQEGILYQRPYIESSPAYKSKENGIQSSDKLPAWLKEYFAELSSAKLGVYPAPFTHQIKALEEAFSGKDIFVSTGTGSGKTECFMWPLMAKLVEEARNKSDSWKLRGVRTIIMYPMNALVSDQVSRLRKLIGDPDHNFVNIFRKFSDIDARRPQFGMYTGRTPYAGPEPRKDADRRLEDTYKRMVYPKNEDGKIFLSKLIKEGKIPSKENFNSFLEKLHNSDHIPDNEDAELVTRFEMQQFCPDILITNYSMLEYMLLRPLENKIWNDTKLWLKSNSENKLLFVIDEAHMYRGSAGGEVALLIRRLFHKLGIERSRVQFILTTASMPNNDDEDKKAVHDFANALTASDIDNKFCYLTGEKEKIAAENCLDIPIEKFVNIKVDWIESDEDQCLKALNVFWSGIPNASVPFLNFEDACQWLFDNIINYKPFCSLFQMCRGTAVSLQELAETIFPNSAIDEAIHAVSVMLAIAPLAHNQEGSVLFPARMHMLFRGIKGVYACTNPKCPHARSENGLTLGEIYFSDGRMTCKECGSSVYELYNDRRCGSIFFKGYVLTKDFEERKKTYLWHLPGIVNNDEVKEIHLFIPEEDYQLPRKQGKNKIFPCYLDVKSGFIDFSDDSLEGKAGIRKLYYSDFTAKGRPNILTFSTCPHCRHELSKMQLTSFGTRGNLSFFNLIKAQFQAQSPVKEKMNNPELFPNEGRKVLLFSDSRQRAAKLARDMSDASDMTAVRQLVVLAIQRMEQEPKAKEISMNSLYDFFAMVAAENHVPIFKEQQQSILLENGNQALKSYQRCKKRGIDYTPRFSIVEHAPNQMKEQILKLYCGGYNTLENTALSWIEPLDSAKWDAIEDLEDAGIEITEKEFLEFFNAWILWVCDSFVGLGQNISDDIRLKVRPNYAGYGINKDWHFPTTIREIMGWKDKDPAETIWARVLREKFMAQNELNSGKYYIDLSRIRPRFDLNHQWYTCERCSELTPYLLKGKCPSCQCERIHPMTQAEIRALDFWRQPILDAMNGERIHVIDTEEHTAQLSHKDQRDDLWAKTEQYELRFQDFLKPGQTPVDILSSTTTMEVGIDIGSLVAVGLRNIPPMRENYQQRAGRAGRRGASLSTIVTFCEDGPHDALYFSNPVPMFRGDPRKPWIDISSEKIIQRHLSMIALQSYLNQEEKSLDAIPAITFLSEHLDKFYHYLNAFVISETDILVPVKSKTVLKSYKSALINALNKLKDKCDKHPELFETDDESESGRKSLLDALYDDGIIPTYSFPKNVVNTYITNSNGKIEYQIERGLDVAIGEYAPGRAIVVDKTTYQIGGLYYPGAGRKKTTALSPAKTFIQDANYLKEVLNCEKCGWFGLREDHIEQCPFCGNTALTLMRPMLRPWGFAPKDAKPIETAQLNEEYSTTQQPLYSTLPEADDVSEIIGCKNIRMAVRPNQRIIMLNNGVDNKGFIVCCDCGAAMPGNDNDVLKGIMRPYYSTFNHSRCKHEKCININLGYDFITDMWVLEFKLDKKRIDVNSARNSWLNRAGQSLAEALRLAVCQELDIEFTELVTGYRIRQSANGDYVDVYLYDSLSSGAGYAVSIANQANELLKKTRQILENCSCENACYKCLKHYRNQNVHGLLDRKAALNLLNWGEKGMLPNKLTITEQKAILSSLIGILEQSGVNINFYDNKIMVNGKSCSKELLIYPAMWTKPKAAASIFISDAQIKYAKPQVLKIIVEGL